MQRKIIHLATRKVAASLLLLLLCTGVNAQGWELKKDEDGIKVFTGSADNSDFKTIKVECMVNATLSQFIALLLDINKQPEWVYGSKSAEFVKVTKTNDFIFHSQVGVPWPFSDRDYIAHITINQPSPELLTVDSRSEPDALPAKDGIIRVKKSRAHWDVTSVSKGLLKIVYTVSFDPSGSVPAWLANMFVTKGPFVTFQKLKDRVGQASYQNAHYDFIRE